jgi:hypothetical protein|tara:strand:- start:5488 stop:5853 length:366 start_codon:yes stop_codon:yes gene_type:complete
MKMLELIIKQFNNPDELREFEKGKFELIQMPGMTIGKATYQPGWKWSNDVSPLSGTKFCEVEHLGIVLSGEATIVFKDGKVNPVKKGDVFYVPSEPHDSWVLGEEEYISIHFLGAGKYANK